MKNFLFVTTISGFLPQFELNDAKLAKELGCRLYYASNFDNPVYRFSADCLEDLKIKRVPIPIRKSPLNLAENFQAILKLKRLMEEEHIDIVHCHNPMGAVCARVAARLGKQHPYVIYTAHGFHFYKGAPVKNWLLYYTAERFLARWTDCLITINGEDYRRAGEFHLKEKGTVRQIHSVGVDSHRFRPQPELRLPVREELGIPADAFHIVTAAELNNNKNQKVIIEAIASLGRSDVFYSICGKGPREENLRQLIRKYGLEDRIKLLGYRTDMDRILQSADLFAFPSKREGLGVAAVEALLCGVPLLVADNRGTREYAIEDKNALISYDKSPEDYRRKILALVERPQLLQRLAENSRPSAMMFSVEEVRTTMRPIYEEAIRNC